MGFYDHYSSRERNKYGVKIKLVQNRKIFEYGLRQYNGKPKVLELGPGDGYIANLCKIKEFSYLGIEGSISIYKKLIKQGFNVLNNKFPPLPKNIGKFDRCYFLHVIEHLNSIGEAEILLESINSVLSDDGLLIIATPDFLKWGKHFYNSDYSHNLPFTRRRLTQLLYNSGFKILEYNNYVGPLFGRISLLLYMLLKYSYSSFIDELINKKPNNSIWYRAYLTFLPSIILVAKKV